MQRPDPRSAGGVSHEAAAETASAAAVWGETRFNY